MADIIDALACKLQSKICYHRVAMLEYLEIKDMVDKLVEENKKVRDEKMEYQDMINTIIDEKENLEHDYQAIKEQVAPIKEQLETVKKELAVAKEQLAAEKYERVAANHENLVTKEELLMAKEQLARKNEELEVSRKKLQESEATQTQLRQQKRKAPGPEPVHSTRVTRATYKWEMLLQGPLANDAKEQLARNNEELEVLRKKLQESEDMHTQLQQRRSSLGHQPVHFRRVTRSTQKRKMLLQGSLVNDADSLTREGSGSSNQGSQS